MSQIKAQETTVTVGEGAQKSWSVPFDMYNGVGVCQILYTAAELGINETASISSFALNFYGETDDAFNLQTGNPDVDGNFKVYLQNTTISELNSFVEVTGDPYFDGYKVLVNDGWTTFDFNSSFSYNGENLIVTFVDYRGSSRINWYTFYVDEIQKRCISGSVEFSTTGLSLSDCAYRPRSQFVVTTGSQPQPLSATASTEKETIYSDETVQLTATANGGSGNYTYSWSPATGLDNTSIATPIFTPSAVGTYTFTCTVSDGTETVSTNEVTVIVEDAPLRCLVIFTLKDSYGDGWNGGKLSVEYDGKKEDLTIDNGGEEKFEIKITQGSSVTIIYSPGGYANENSYVITYEDGEEIASGTGSSNAFYETFTVDCSLKAPKAPSVFAKAASETSILLVWNEVDGATSYNIYNGDNIVAKSVTAISYTINNLTTGQEYCYTVTAVNEVGESEKSEPACATPKTLPTIDLAKYYRINVYNTSNYLYFSDYYASAGSTAATVSTKQESNRQIFKIEDAGNGNYYIKTLDGNYIKCADQPNANGNNYWSVFAYSNEDKTPLYFDYVDGVQFYIRDYDKVLGNGSEANNLPGSNYFKVENGVYCDAPSNHSNVVTWVLEEVPTLEGVKPTGLVATLNGRSVTLTWNPVDGATSYNVYMDGENISTDMLTTPTYTVSGLSAETEYCFTVTANNLISESDHPEAVCVTTGAKELPEVPNLLSISVNTTTITLIWEASAGATSYNVYRDGEQVQTGITELTYTDSGLTEDTRYCYSVAAVNSDGESEQSDELCAKTQEMGGGEEEIEEIAGIGSNYNNNLPIYSGATGKYSMSQQYYTKDEINNTGGNITSISYYVYANANLTHNLEIYLNNVDEFGFEVDNMYQSPCRQVSANDLVFVGDVTFPSGEGWVEIKLGKPFMYTGNHILVTVVDNTPSTKGKAFYTRLFEKENCTGYYNSGNSIDPTINSYQMYVITRRNDIRFTFAASAPTIEFINDGDWNTAGNWNTGAVPSTTDDVIIKANATINGDIEVKHLSVEGGSLTIESGSLTVADIMVNNYAEDLIIKDGAQLFQGYDKVKGTFVMKINKPEDWNEWNKTGWQFIASPFINAAVSQFTSADTYDLYKFDGQYLTEEWRNHKDPEDGEDFETKFVSGRGYMASYQKNTTATLSGTFNNATLIDYPVTYQDIQEGKPHWPNFHLLGNPFTFDMDLSKLSMTGMAEGVAMVNDGGTYDYMTTGTIKVGDGFFVKSTAANPVVSYSNVPTRGGNDDNASDNISVRVSSSATRDNVVLNFAGSDKAGFPKLNAFNEDAAYLYVVSEEQRYGIFNYDKDVNEVSLSFEAQKMGKYTISVDAEGEYETIVLVDRQTGIETNMLLEDYSFTATSSSKENTDRFLVRFTFRSDVNEDAKHFAYQSGDELIIEAEGTVQLFDVTGRMLYIGEVESHGERINVGHLNNAAYILRLVNEEGVKVQKVIIY